jgi:hypothetical protein
MTFGAAQHWAAAAFVLAALVAGSATAFGFEFAPESHGHEEEAEVERAADEKAKHEGEEEALEREEEDGAGMVPSAILVGLAGGALAPLTGLGASRREGEGTRCFSSRSSWPSCLSHSVACPDGGPAQAGCRA